MNLTHVGLTNRIHPGLVLLRDAYWKLHNEQLPHLDLLIFTCNHESGLVVRIAGYALVFMASLNEELLRLEFSKGMQLQWGDFEGHTAISKNPYFAAKCSEVLLLSS